MAELPMTKPVQMSSADASIPLKRWKESPLARRLRTTMFVGFIIFFIAQFLPLSGKSINNIFYVLLLPPALLACVFFRTEMLAHLRQMLPLLFFFAVTVVLAACLGDLGSAKTTLYVFFFCLAILILFTDEPRRAWLAFLCFAVTALLVMLLSSFKWIADLWQYHVFIRQAAWGRANNPIYGGLLTVSALLFLWIFVIEPACLRRIWRIAGLAAILGLTLLAILIFQSRSALLGLLVFLPFYALFRNHFLSVIALAGAFALLLWLSGYHEAVLIRGLSYRPEIWLEAISKLSAECNVVFGCGDFPERFLGYSGTHSGYVGTLFRYGIVGCAAFTVFTVWYFVLCIRNRSNWFLISLIGWGGMLTAMDGFIGSPHAWWVFFWFPTIAAIAESRSAQAERNAFAVEKRETPA